MRLLMILLAALACTTVWGREWEARLHGDAIVLLGEVHDNPEHHRMRLASLRRAVEAGWRPAIAMEQFDRDRQGDIERARREKPLDAQHVIDSAAPRDGGWPWAFYRPVIALALEFGLPIVAANLSNADTSRIVRHGFEAVFDAAAMESLGLGRAIAPEWQAAQEREIDVGHCGMLPRHLWPAMARAQFARDAVMAAALRRHAAHGVVLLAGNGHVRRDFGVPRWLEGSLQSRVLAVGYLETEDAPPAAYDAIERAPAPDRIDPCAGLRKKLPGP